MNARETYEALRPQQDGRLDDWESLAILAMASLDSLSLVLRITKAQETLAANSERVAVALEEIVTMFGEAESVTMETMVETVIDAEITEETQPKYPYQVRWRETDTGGEVPITDCPHTTWYRFREGARTFYRCSGCGLVSTEASITGLVL